MWITTVSGKRFNVFNYNTENITIFDIAHALSKEQRFMNHMHCEHYSVADHCVNGLEFVSEANKKQFFLHDAAEYIMRDMSSKFKPFMYFRTDVGFISYKDLENKILSVILKKYDCDPVLTEEVHEIDRQITIREAQLFTNIESYKNKNSIFRKIKTCRNAMESYEQYLTTFSDLWKASCHPQKVT